MKADIGGAVALIKERQRELKKLSDPVGSPDFLEILRDATRLLLAMPPIQVSIERLFGYKVVQVRPLEPLEGGHIQQFAATQVQLLVFISIILK